MTQIRHLSLSGSWRNQLGSVLTLDEDGKGGLQGRYQPGAGSDVEGSYVVTGSYDPVPFGSITVLGFVVDWLPNHSVTVWSGQHHAVTDEIQTTWLLTTETIDSNEWRSTVIGHDVFRRKQSGEEVGHGDSTGVR